MTSAQRRGSWDGAGWTAAAAAEKGGSAAARCGGLGFEDRLYTLAGIGLGLDIQCGKLDGWLEVCIVS